MLKKCRVLLRGIRNKTTPTAHTDVTTIAASNHITYKYILWTMLLAKSVNPNINALSLQASDSLTGAYDARSICHRVIIPFEAEHFERISSGTEPFLNKPARFKHLSSDNPTRSKKDAAILQTLIRIANDINATPTKAQSLLTVFMQTLKPKPPSTVRKRYCNTVEETRRILEEYFPLHTIRVNNHFSSNNSKLKGLDIDVLKNDQIIHTFEIKDKPFTQADIDTTTMTATRKKLSSYFFIYGDKATGGVNAPRVCHIETLRALLSIQKT